MQVKSEDIHPELRRVSMVLRKVQPYYTEELFYKSNAFMDKVLKGKWLGRHTRVDEVHIPRKGEDSLRVLVCRSKKHRKQNATGLLWIHGGGYATGLPEQDFIFADPFTEDGSCVTVLPDYRRSTKAPYPAALEDCYRTLLWMKKNAVKLGINPNQLFVGGDSAGGGLTAALSLYARDKQKVSIAFQMPLYPMIDDRMITESSRDNDAPVWNTKSNMVAWKLYLRGLEGQEIPAYAAPSRAEDYTALPSALTYVGTIEPFYDETVEYVRKLKAAGVKVHFKEYEGCFHAFDMLGDARKVSKNARRFLMRTFRYAQKHYFAEN